MKKLAGLDSAKLYAVAILIILLLLAARVVTRPLMASAELRGWIVSAMS